METPRREHDLLGDPSHMLLRYRIVLLRVPEQ